MYIIAHRGYWKDLNKANSLESIKDALKNGYGFESDIRDYLGDIVISHNIASKESPKLDSVFKEFSKYNNKYCFAINIKADGLVELLKKYICKYNITNYFLFDMSVPQMIEYKEFGFRFYTRQSEIETNPILYDKAFGVWIDGFWSYDWITNDLILKHISNKKEVCIVSPELHGKDYKEFWKQLKKLSCIDNLSLCTNYPDEAKEYFNEN